MYSLQYIKGVWVYPNDRYPGEMHIVHYNSKYESLGEALLHSDGLAVLGVFVEVLIKLI